MYFFAIGGYRFTVNNEGSQPREIVIGDQDNSGTWGLVPW